MKYRLPVSSEIIPYSTQSKHTGGSVLSSVEVDFDEMDILSRVSRRVHGEEIEYICLSLGENPSTFDSYLCKVIDVELKEE